MDSAQDEVVQRLDEEACWELLRRGEVGRLAVTIQGHPDIFPVNYVVDEGRILFRTAPGSKLAELAANPQVAFEVDESDGVFAASVVVKGVAERMELQHEIDEADALPLRPWIPTRKYRWVRIVPGEMTGRRFRRGPEPERYDGSDDDTWA